VSLIPNDQPEDSQLSNYKLEMPSSQLRRAQEIKEKMESSKCWDIAIYWQYPTTNCGLVEASLMPQLVA
jgi:hypothetical protein